MAQTCCMLYNATLLDKVDPHQFSFYRSTGSVDIVIALLSIHQHLDTYTHAGLFLVYSSEFNTIRAMNLTVKLADPGCLQKLRWSRPTAQNSCPSSNREPTLGQKHRYSSEQWLSVMRPVKEAKLKTSPSTSSPGQHLFSSIGEPRF